MKEKKEGVDGEVAYQGRGGGRHRADDGKNNGRP